MIMGGPTASAGEDAREVATGGEAPPCLEPEGDAGAPSISDNGNATSDGLHATGGLSESIENT